MEPDNHLFEKENHLPNLHVYQFLGSMLVFGGVNLYVVCWCQYVSSLTITSLPISGAPVRVGEFEEVDGSKVIGSVGYNPNEYPIYK